MALLRKSSCPYMKPCPRARRVKRRWRANCRAPRLARAPGQLAKPGRYGLLVTTRFALACGARLTGGDGVGGCRPAGPAEAPGSLRRRPRQGLSPPLGVISQRHRRGRYTHERATSTTKCPPNKPPLHPLVQACRWKTFTAPRAPETGWSRGQNGGRDEAVLGEEQRPDAHIERRERGRI